MISPLKEKVRGLMEQCEDENLVEIREKIEDLSGVNNIKDLNIVYTKIADPYNEENMKMGMQTMREFLNGDAKVRSEIFRRKEKIEKEHKRREYLRMKILKQMREEEEERIQKQKALDRSSNTPRSNILSELTPQNTMQQGAVDIELLN